MAEEGDRRHDHQADLDDLNALNQERLFVLICELTGNRRKKEKWQAIQKLFAYLEANAGKFWSVPTFSGTERSDYPSSHND